MLFEFKIKPKSRDIEHIRSCQNYKSSVEKDKKKIIPRKQKYKNREL